MALNAHARAWGRDDHLPELPPEPENLGGGGAGLNKFRVVGRNIVTTNQLKHDADMKEMAEAMKGEKTIKEGPLEMYKKGGMFSKSKFVPRWVRLTHEKEKRVKIEYFEKSTEPTEFDVFKDVFKLENPGIVEPSERSKKALKVADANCYVFQIKVGGRDDAVVAFQCKSLQEQEEWERTIKQEVTRWLNLLNSNRNQPDALRIRSYSQDQGNKPPPPLPHQEDEEEDDDDDDDDDVEGDDSDGGTEFTETDDDGTVSSYTESSAPSKSALAPATLEPIKEEKAETKEAPAKPKRGKVPANQVSVDSLEDRFTDAALASSKSELDELVASCKATCDPQSTGYVKLVELERFVLETHFSAESHSLTTAEGPVHLTDAHLELRSGLGKHIDGEHFSDHGVSWETQHASPHAATLDREKLAMGLKRSTLVSTAVGKSALASVVDLGPGNNPVARSLGIDQHVSDDDAEDWNKLYQTALKMPEKKYADAIEKGLVVHRLQRKMVKIATLAGRTIIDEFSLPNGLKSITPIDMEMDDSDDAEPGELTYVYRNLLIRLNVQDEEAMHKIAGNEMRSMKAMQEASTRAYQKVLIQRGFDSGAATHPLSIILSVLVDYNGFRFFVMSMPPIDEGRTQVYGREDTHDPNSVFLDKNANFHALHGAACEELNLKPHLVISDGEAIKINGSVETQGHYCYDGRFYAINFARLMPSDLPNDGMEMLTKQLRPELVKSFRMPLSSDAFSHLTLPPKDEASAQLLGDADQSDVEVGSASRFLLKDRVPEFVAQLDSLRTFPYDSGTFTQACHKSGINMRHIGRIAEHTRLPHVREMVVVEMLARAGKVILGRGHRRIISKAKDAALGVMRQKAKVTGTKKIDHELKMNMIAYADRLREDTIEHVVDFINLMVGSPNDRENSEFWTHVLLPSLAQKFDYNHSSVSDPLRIDRRNICPMQLFHALQHHCCIRFVSSENYPFDQDAFPVSTKNVVSLEPSCKYISNDGLDLNIVAAMAESEREKKRYLVALQGFRMRLFMLNNVPGLPSDLESARTYNQIADMYVLDYVEGFSRQPKKDPANDEVEAVPAETPQAALDMALEYSDKALALVPHTHGLASRIHETRMKIFFERGDENKMLREFVAGMKAVLCHYGASGNHPFVCEMHCVLGTLFKRLNRVEAAKEHLQKAKELAVKILGGTHSLLASYTTQLAHVLIAAGEIDQAIVSLDQAKAIFETTVGPASLEVANSLFFSAECLVEQGNMTNAAESARRALTIREEALAAKTIEGDDDRLLSSYYQMASLCVANSEHGHAAHYYELVLAGLRATTGQTDQVLREIQRVTRDILNLRILTLAPVVMRRLQIVVNKHRPDKLLLAITGDEKGSMELMPSLKEVIEQISSNSPSQYVDDLVKKAGLVEPSSNAVAGGESVHISIQSDVEDAEKALACIIALTEQHASSSGVDKYR